MMTIYQEDMLVGKTAVITGVSRKIGIGAAIARAFAEVGCQVFTTYYRPYDATMPWGSQQDEAEGLLAELRHSGIPAAGLELDLSDPAAPVQLFTAAEAAFGPIDILVNNAAYSVNDGVSGLTAVHIDNHYAVNVRGMMLLCAEFVKRFRGDWGRIINLTSGQGAGPMPGELAYAATKGAVDAFTVSLAAAVAAQQITVNAVDPGGTDTGWMWPELVAQLTAQSPTGRVGQPEDAARLVRFLASPEAGWITGQIIRSRGGL